jgi:hypothetical protein
MSVDLPPGVLSLVAAAEAVRQRRFGSVEGRCRDITLATALSSGVEFVAVCYGTVRVGDDDREHFWCQTENWIVDPTADQFWGPPQAKVSQFEEGGVYKEQFHFFLWPETVLRLAGIREVRLRGEGQPDGEDR